MRLDFTHKLAQVRIFGARLAALALIGAGLLLSLGSTVAGASPTMPVAHTASTSEMGTISLCSFDETDHHPMIGRGSRGSAVSHAQCLLRYHWGKQIAIDGIFGPLTENAVIEVQTDCGLGIDGIVGPETWPVLHQAHC